MHVTPTGDMVRDDGLVTRKPLEQSRPVDELREQHTYDPPPPGEGSAHARLLVALDVGDVSSRVAVSRAVLDHAPLGMAVCAADGRVLWRNAAYDRIAAGPAADPAPGPAADSAAGPAAGGRGVDALVGDLVRACAARLAAGEHVAEERCRLRPDGGSQWLSLTASAVLDVDGEDPRSGGAGPGAWVVVQALDVTDRKEAETQLAQAHADLLARNAELERSNEELAEFAYVASHDLSEPLRVISGHVELLARRYAGRLDADADRYIAFAVDGAARLRRLIDDLLSYSRVGRRVPEATTLDTAALVDRAVQSAAAQTPELRAEVVAPLPVVRADATLLGQVLANLVGNAAKFAATTGRPRVRVSATRTGGEWRFDVADNGPGVPPDHRQRVFRIFERMHTRDVPGTGIGLAIARRAVERLGGRIWIDDSPLGGALFSFTLPAREV